MTAMRLQFGLRGLLLFTLAVAAIAAWSGSELRRAAVLRAAEDRALVRLLVGDGWAVKRPSTGAAIASFFSRSHARDFERTIELYPRELPDENLADLRFLTELRRIEVWPRSGTDASLMYVGACTTLEHLKLRGTRITSDGLRHLVRLKNLKDLDVSQTDGDR